jgi:hypothetical protein
MLRLLIEGNLVKTLALNAYAIDELAPGVLAKVIDRLRVDLVDDQWWDSVYEDADSVATILGITIDRSRSGRFPAIEFSGFSSQGDGACFTGRYQYSADATKQIRSYAPIDSTLHAFADELAAIHTKHTTPIEVSIVRNASRYCHERSVDVNVSLEGDDDELSVPRELDDGVVEQMRRLMRWIYRQLENEYEYQTSDDRVRQSAFDNELLFTANGVNVTHLA